MDFMFHEMWLCLINKKSPLYAPYAMKLIKEKDTVCPLVVTNLVVHKLVKPLKKASKIEKAHMPYGDDKEMKVVMRMRLKLWMCPLLLAAPA